MADHDFNFDEFLSESDQESTGTTKDTRNTRTTNNTSNTSDTTKSRSLHPFSVRLNEEYVEKIKAMAWWKRISQRTFIEQAVESITDQMEAGELDAIIEKYQKQKANE